MKAEHKAIADALIAVLRPELASLKRRLAEVEEKSFSYEGPHETERTYSKGMFVTHDGSLWHCNRKTATKPGEGNGWTLAVKRGKDAR